MSQKDGGIVGKVEKRLDPGVYQRWYIDGARQLNDERRQNDQRSTSWNRKPVDVWLDDNVNNVGHSEKKEDI